MKIHPNYHYQIRTPYQSRNCEVSGMHFLSEPVHLAPCIEKNNSLCNGQCLIQVTKRIQFPFLQYFKEKGNNYFKKISNLQSLEVHCQVAMKEDILHQILRQRTLDIKKEVHPSLYNLVQLLFFLCVLC